MKQIYVLALYLVILCFSVQAQKVKNENCGEVYKANKTVQAVAVYTKDGPVPKEQTCTWDITTDSGLIAEGIIQNTFAKDGEFVQVIENNKNVTIYRKPGKQSGYYSTGSTVTVVFPPSNVERDFKSFDVRYVNVDAAPNRYCGKVDKVDSNVKEMAVYTGSGVVPKDQTCTWKFDATTGLVAVGIVPSEQAKDGEFVQVADNGKFMNVYRKMGEPNSYTSTGSSVTVVFPPSDVERKFNSFNVRYEVANNAKCGEKPAAPSTTVQSFMVAKSEVDTLPKDLACTWTLVVKSTEKLTVTLAVATKSSAQCVSVTSDEQTSEQMICGTAGKNSYTAVGKPVTVKFMGLLVEAADVSNFNVSYQIVSDSKAPTASRAILRLVLFALWNLD